MSTYHGLKVSCGLAVLSLSLSTMVYSAETNPPVAVPPGQSEIEQLRELRAEVERLQRENQLERHRTRNFQLMLGGQERLNNELQGELNRLREGCKRD